MANCSQILTMDSSSPLMEQLIMFHDHTLLILLMITIMVSYLLIEVLINKQINRFLLEGQTIELIWTFFQQ